MDASRSSLRPFSSPRAGSDGGAPLMRGILLSMMIVGLVGVCLAALFSRTGAFTVDEVIYVEMAAAMADEGRLSFQQIKLDGVQSMNGGYGVPVADGRVASRYPSGYAFVAAPFYKAFGVDGLVLMNALSGVACAFLVFRLCAAAGGRGLAPTLAAGMFLIATMAPNYLFSIWPHMLGLTFVLGAALLALRSVGDRHEAVSACAAWRGALAAGLLIGFGASVRVDVIFAGFAILFWLRFFVGRAGDRQSFAFVGGVLSGVVFCAVLNHAKFGVFHPFSYQETKGAAVFSQYTLALAFITASLGGSFFIDVPSVAKRLWRAAESRLAVTANRWAVISIFMIAVCLAVAFIPSVQKLMSGYLVLLFDLQLHPSIEARGGVERDAFGVVQFWGVYKKALLQSLPFAPLVILGVLAYLRGGAATGVRDAIGYHDEARRADSLLWLIAGAYVTFYAINRWHGGLALNLRYFLPVAAILAILIGRFLPALAAHCSASRRAFVWAFLFGFGSFSLVVIETFKPAAWRGVLEVYPQLLPALALSVFIGIAMVRGRDLDWRRVVYGAAFAIGAAIAINMGDVSRDRIIRHLNAEEGAIAAAALPPDALVMTSDPAAFARRAASGLTVLYPGLDTEAATRTLVQAYRDAGRCVAGHSAGAAYLEEQLGYRAVHRLSAADLIGFGGCASTPGPLGQ
ncbi:MAG: hypothetical protein AAF224_12110 [Pseudomonadota bacterium]